MIEFKCINCQLIQTFEDEKTQQKKPICKQCNCSILLVHKKEVEYKCHKCSAIQTLKSKEPVKCTEYYLNKKIKILL